MPAGLLPPDIAPASAFRLLLETPRPVAPLSYRLPSAAGYALHARALHPVELYSARSMGGDLFLVSQALCTESGAPLLTIEQAGNIDSAEFARLYGSVIHTLGQICPSYATSDVAAWRALLKRGARSFPSVCWMMGGADGVGSYFGLPGRQVLDGHIMAFQAGREVFEEMKRRDG